MISVIIPTFKNKKQFLHNLKLNLSYLDDCELIIVNDNPDVSLKKELKEYNNLNLIENKKNLGFGPSVNEGVKKAKNNLIMLLNDDVLLLNDSYKLAIEEFKKNRSLFAVSFTQKEKNNEIVGKNKIVWRYGLFYHLKSKNLKPGINAWAEGGASLVDKKKFLILKGFDNIYKPFYWEDVDLSYRAWKLGYRIVFNPNIIVEHHHESTIGKLFSKEYVKKTAYRNQFLFIWKNISGLLLFKHIILLAYNLLYYSLLKREKEFLVGFIEAIKMLGQIDRTEKYKTSDAELLRLFKYE